MPVTYANTNAGHRKHFPFYDGLFPHVPREASLTEQGRKTLNLIKRDGRVTRLTALHYGIANLTARIAELREEGYAVDCEIKLDANGRKYGSWFLATGA